MRLSTCTKQELSCSASLSRVPASSVLHARCSRDFCLSCRTENHTSETKRTRGQPLSVSPEPRTRAPSPHLFHPSKLPTYRHAHHPTSTLSKQSQSQFTFSTHSVLPPAFSFLPWPRSLFSLRTSTFSLPHDAASSTPAYRSLVPCQASGVCFFVVVKQNAIFELLVRFVQNGVPNGFFETFLLDFE